MSSRPGGSGGPKLRRLNMGQVFIILAVVSAVLTIFVFKSLMSNKAPQKQVEVKTKPLVIASQQLFSGEVITPESVKVVDWPEEYYPEGGVYTNTKKLYGRVVKESLHAGAPVFKMNLAGEDAKAGMPVVIPPGHRAMTILVSENKGVGGFVRPGDRVDVIGTFRFEIPESTQKAVAEKSQILYQDNLNISQTVLQDVLVLATAQKMYQKESALEAGMKGEKKKDDDKASSEGNPTEGKVVSSITLAVTPEQGEKLALTENRAQLTLALRPFNDHEEMDLLGAADDDILPLADLFERAFRAAASLGPDLLAGGKEDEIPPPDLMPSTADLGPPPVMHDIQVIEGTESSNVSF